MTKVDYTGEEHLDYPIIAKTHSPLYSMHRFWARKPHNVVAEYIKHYSKIGDIVLDPFVGSGVTGIESLRLGRKTVLIDLNPIANFITHCSLIDINTEHFCSAFKNIKNKVKTIINELYETQCTECSTKFSFFGMAWKDNEPFEIVYTCPVCYKKRKKKRAGSETSKRKRKKIDKFDKSKIKKVWGMKIPYWYPRDATLTYPSGIEFSEGTHKGIINISELFTKRNLIALSILFNEIESLTENSEEERNIKNLMKFTFTSALPQTTKMMPYVHESKGKICKGWIVQRYWLPPESWELNVWNYFELRFNEILRGKQDGATISKQYKEAKHFSDLKNNANTLIKTHSATELIDKTFPHKSIVLPNSIDYVFTDPPYGGSIQYFELSKLWASWLKMDLNFEDEITINKSQNKNFETYDRMLRTAFKQIYEVVKPSRYMTVTFHNTDIRIRNSLIRAVVFAGFDLEKIVYQPPAVKSVKSGLQPYGSAIGDYYIRFKKPKQPKKEELFEISEERYERVVVDTVKRVIAERGEPTPYTYIINSIDVELEKQGLLLGAKKEVKDVLKEHLDEEFVLVDIGEGLIKGKGWWFKDPSKIAFLDRVPLSERVEKAILDVLKRRDTVSFDEVLQEIFIKFPNSLTPATQSVRSLLNEYALPVRGKWRLKQDFKEHEKKHSKIIEELVKLGKKFGFDTYTAHSTQETLKTAKRELKLPIDRIKRVKEIDVLWYKNNKIYSAFEVENTTQIAEAIIRGANIPYKTQKFIVIPKEREPLLKRRLSEPLLKAKIKEDYWKVFTYEALEKCLGERNLTLKKFEEIAKFPRSREEIQKDDQARLADY